MTRTVSLITATLIVAAVSARPHNQSDPGNWNQTRNYPPIFAKAMEAARNLRYIGTRVVEFHNDGKVERHRETITRDHERVRIEFPDDGPFAGQVIVENANERRHFFPDKNEIQILPPRIRDAFDRMRGPRGGQLGFSTGPGEAIAGFKTDEVVVRDKSGNLVQRIFIEPNSGLILKRSLYDPTGAEYGSFEFKSVDLNPQIDPKRFVIRHKGAKIVTPADLLQRLARERDFVALTLPRSSGYRLEGAFSRDIDGNPVLLQFYKGDSGNQRLTLFELKRSISPDRVQRLSRGNLKSVTWQAGSAYFVLVGNLDEASLRRIAAPIMGGTAASPR